MVQPSFSIKFDKRQLRKVDRALKEAPKLLLKNLDRANRSTAQAIARDAIRNLSGGKLTGVDTGDLKRSVIVAQLGPLEHAVGVPVNIKQGRFLETGTGTFTKAPKSKGRFTSNLKVRRTGFIKPKRKKFLKFTVRSKRGRKVRPRIPGNRAFVINVGGQRTIFTKMTRGLKPRFWLSNAAQANEKRHFRLTSLAIEATVKNLGRRA